MLPTVCSPCLHIAGAIMEKLAHKLLGLKTCAFVPTHARNLGNEFRCYANYETSLLYQQLHITNDLAIV